MSPAATARVDHLVTRDLTVDGRPTSYADGGRGLPVLFLHGWGLDHRAYHRPLRTLTARGCRVLAPSLPGFGGTDELPRRERTLDGYARWVGRFLAAVGVDEPVVVLGHSFGGGVATKFVHDHVDAATYLVLLNSVGDPRSFPGASRSVLSMNVGPSELLRPLLQALHPSGDGIATFATTQRLFMENVARHPLSVLETAGLALTADLSSEMSALASRKVPVLILWSDHDEIVPMSAFDTFCTTFGTDGHVVRGGHSWLLANPKAFDEVLANVIHLQREAYGSTAATANAAQLEALLRETTVPRAVTTRLLDEVSPLWVLSESPAVLAADLALCHPRLGNAEVRAVAREIPATGMYRLTVVAHDRPGLLADTTAVLAAEGVSIVAASAMTWPKQDLALHSVTVRSGRGIDPARWATIGERLQAMQHSSRPPFRFVPAGRARVTQSGEGGGRSVIRVSAPDRLGLLSTICRWFADRGLSIEAAAVDTVDGRVTDVFLVHGECDVDQLAQDLSGHTSTVAAVCAAALAALVRCGRP